VAAVWIALAVSVMAGAAHTREAAAQERRELPPIDALVPNFYYDDVDAAKRWYVDKLGFRMMIDLGWVAIVELQPGMQIALVDGERGTLHAVQDKGALLVIETAALEAWYTHVSAIDGIEWYLYPDDPRRTRLPNGLMEHPEIHLSLIHISEPTRRVPHRRPGRLHHRVLPLEAGVQAAVAGTRDLRRRGCRLSEVAADWRWRP